MERVGAQSEYTRVQARAPGRSVRARARVSGAASAATRRRFRDIVVDQKETTPGRAAARRAPAGGCGGSRRRRSARCRSRARVRSHASAGVRVTLELMVGGARVGRNASPRRRIRRGNVSSAVRVLSNRLVGFSGAFRRVTTPEPTPTLRRVFSAAQSGARQFVAQIDRPSLESRTVESTRRGEPGDRKRRNRSHAVEFRPRLSSRGTARAPKFVWTNSLPRPNLDRIDRARGSVRPRALTRTRESRTPAIALSRRKPRERGHAGDADALAEGTASSRARDAQGTRRADRAVVFSADDTR